MEAVGHTCRNSPFWEVNNLDSNLTLAHCAHTSAHIVPPQTSTRDLTFRLSRLPVICITSRRSRREEVGCGLTDKPTDWLPGLEVGEHARYARVRRRGSREGVERARSPPPQSANNRLGNALRDTSTTTLDHDARRRTRGGRQSDCRGQTEIASRSQIVEADAKGRLAAVVIRDLDAVDPDRRQTEGGPAKTMSPCSTTTAA